MNRQAWGDPRVGSGGSKGVLRLTLHVAYSLLNMGRGTRLTFFHFHIHPVSLQWGMV